MKSTITKILGLGLTMSFVFFVGAVVGEMNQRDYAKKLCSFVRFEEISRTYEQFGDGKSSKEVAKYIFSRPLYCEDMIEEYNSYMKRHR